MELSEMKRKVARIMPRGVFSVISSAHHFLQKIAYYALFLKCPMEDKVVATSFDGAQYADNTRYIVEQLHACNEGIDIVWIVDGSKMLVVPSYIRLVNKNRFFKMAKEYATAKVWIDTHYLPRFLHKKKGQLFIDTWHGGLGIKRIGRDINSLDQNHIHSGAQHTSAAADLFISNSNHLNSVYRNSLGYQGKIWKVGYPKNDITLSNRRDEYRKRVNDRFDIKETDKIVVYAPTFRWGGLDNPKTLERIYNLDYESVVRELENAIGEHWRIIVRFHPLLQIRQVALFDDKNVIDATQYPDMQELILAADAFISDYSSCIFDAAIRGVPCFTYATDFQEYSSTQGVYYTMEELPFPYARNNDEMMENIRSFNYEEYLNKWDAFKTQTGLYETGHAARDIAHVISEFIKGNSKPLEDIKSEP